MAQKITIDASGRLVIPKEVRERLHLQAGSRLMLTEDGERISLVPLEAQPVTKEVGGLLVFAGELTGGPPDHRELREERLRKLSQK